MAVQTTISQQSYWLALSLTPGPGPTRGRKLVQHFGSPDKITGTSLAGAEQEIGKANAVGAKIVTPADAESPTRLPEILRSAYVLERAG